MESKTYLATLIVLILLPSSTSGECSEGETSLSTGIGSSGDFDVDIPPETEIDDDIFSLAFLGGDTVDLEEVERIRIKLPDKSFFVLTKLCIATTASEITFAVAYKSGESFRERVTRNDLITSTLTKFCVSELLNKWVWRAYMIFTSGESMVSAGGLIAQACSGSAIRPEFGECGWSQYEDAGIEGGTIPSMNIINGWEARPHEFPWQVQLLVNRGGRYYFCGGSIIDQNYVLTAAHCIASTVAENVTVIMALNSFDERDNATYMGVSEIIGHRYYNPNSIYNDVALLRLEPGIAEWSTAIHPVCMPKQPANDLAGSTLIVSGMGITEEGGNISNDLMYATSPLMGFYDCETCMNEHLTNFLLASTGQYQYYDIIYDGMVCAGNCLQNVRNPCPGDSGGPLMWKNAHGAWELIGVVSWGFGCEAGTPAVYADAHFYQKWMMENAVDSTADFYWI